jgi:hypothetical protein
VSPRDHDSPIQFAILADRDRPRFIRARGGQALQLCLRHHHDDTGCEVTDYVVFRDDMGWGVRSFRTAELVMMKRYKTRLGAVRALCSSDQHVAEVVAGYRGEA